MPPQSISGGSALLLLNGAQVGVCDGVTWDDQIDQFAVRELGNLFVVEHNATAVTIAMQATLVRFRLLSLRAQGMWPSYDGTPAQATANVINFEPMTALIYDRVPDQVICTITGVVPQSRGWQLSQGAVIQANVSMMAQRVLDEQES
jgi:hypothetical protein